jgi:hypothetical protein
MRYAAAPPKRWGSILHGEDFPQTLMRGSQACAVDPVCHSQETLGLTAWRDWATLPVLSGGQSTQV